MLLPTKVTRCHRGDYRRAATARSSVGVQYTTPSRVYLGLRGRSFFWATFLMVVMSITVMTDQSGQLLLQAQAHRICAIKAREGLY